MSGDLLPTDNEGVIKAFVYGSGIAGAVLGWYIKRTAIAVAVGALGASIAIPAVAIVAYGFLKPKASA